MYSFVFPRFSSIRFAGAAHEIHAALWTVGRHIFTVHSGTIYHFRFCNFFLLRARLRTNIQRSISIKSLSGVKRGCVALDVQSSGDPLAVLRDGIQLPPHLLAQKPNDVCPHSQISEDQAFPRIPVLHRTAVLCSLSSQTYGPLHRGARRVCGNGCSRLDCYDGGTREGPSSLTRIEGPSAWILRVPLRLAVPGDPRHCHILRS